MTPPLRKARIPSCLILVVGSSQSTDCVKTPFMVRLGSPRTEARHTEINYLTVRPELRRRVLVEFSHSQSLKVTRGIAEQDPGAADIRISDLVLVPSPV